MVRIDYFAILFDKICTAGERLGRSLREWEGMAQSTVLGVSFAENYAILSLKNGENRIDMEFLKQFNSALDEIERYLRSRVVVKLKSLHMHAC